MTLRDESRAGARPARAPLPLAATVAAGTAAVVSLAPVVVAVVLLRLASGETAPGPSVRLAVAGWLLAHGVRLQVGDGVVGLVPLAVTALAAWRLSRAGVHVTRALGARHSRSWRAAVLAAVAPGLAYGVIGVLVTAAAAGTGWWVPPLRAGAVLAAFGTVVAFTGSVRATGVGPMVAGRAAPVLRLGVRTGVTAALLVLAAGAVAAGVAVAADGSGVAEGFAVYRTDVAGQAGLVLLCLAYAPNLTVWAVAYLTGPGFVVGTDTVVRSSEVVLGPLPAVPVLAGLPDTALPGLGAALLAVPTAAGLTAALVARSREPVGGWGTAAAAGLLAGVVAAVLLGGAAYLSAGPLGAGRLAVMGPVGWQVAAASLVLVTPGTLLGALAGARPRR